ncbi:MAG: FUSC family protein [Alicyclobacillus sp.]|nr:FUSC family protein [Alicyclobacillus sp.]
MAEGQHITTLLRPPRRARGVLLSSTGAVWKAAFGSALVWELARWTGSRHPYLAPLTLILCLQATVGQSLRFAAYRTAGTVLGVLIMGLVAKQVPVAAWSLGLVLLVVTAVLKLFRANDLLIHQVALSLLFVLYFEHQSAGYAWDRAKDTVIGAVVAVLLTVLVFPPNDLHKAEQALQRLVGTFAQTATRVADALDQDLLKSGRHPTEQIDALLCELQEVAQAFDRMRQGARLHIFSAAYRREAAKLQVQYRAMRDTCLYFVSLVSALTDDLTAAERTEWSGAVRALAKEVPAFLYRPSSHLVSPGTTAPQPAFDAGSARRILDRMVHLLRDAGGRLRT